MPLLRQKSGFRDGNAGYREALLQRLIHAAPGCLPVKEIDSAFVELKSVCLELPLGYGSTDRYVDNLLINSDGRICLVECKLGSNPEPDRDVLAQLLDYAGALARLDYRGLRDRVCRAVGRQGDPIADAVLGAGADPDLVADFVASVDRTLRRGQMLLLIVGDRIRDNTERLVELLQERVNLGFTFGLVEMPMFAAGAGSGYIVQPRVVTKTKIIERTVFLVSGPGPELSVQKVEEKGFAQSLSEQDFYSKLAEVDADLPERVRRFVDKVTGLGCETQLLRKYNIYLDDGLGSRLNLMSISPTGTAEVWGTASRDARLGEPAGRDYMERLAVMLPGGRVKADLPNPGSWNLRVDNKVAIPLALLWMHEEEWLQAIALFRDRLIGLQGKRDLQQR
jgi:hypothetical protein